MLLTPSSFCGIVYQRLQKVFFFCAKSRGGRFCRRSYSFRMDAEKNKKQRIELEVRHAYKDYIIMHRVQAEKL